METQNYKLRIICLEPLLGSQPSRDVATEYIAKKNGFEELPTDEQETLPDALERGTTVFNKNSAGRPVLMDYQFKGFLKEAARVLNGSDAVGKLKNLRSKVDNQLFVFPRMIPLTIPEKSDGIDYLERPLRAETAQGPRVALARSEMLPAGTEFELMLSVIPGSISESVIRELLDYGYFKGVGQWRNGSYGRFRYELTAEASA